MNSVLGSIILLIFMAFSYYGLPPIEAMERVVFDAGSRFSLPTKEVDHKIVLVEIDEKSVDTLGSWPWPRALMGKMIDLLEGKGAKVIGLNVPLIEKQKPDGLREVQAFGERFEAYASNQKETAIGSWVQQELARVEENLDNDRRLVESIRRSGNLVLPVFGRLGTGWKTVAAGDDTALSGNFLTERDVPQGLKERHSVSQLYLPFSELAKAALGLGYSNLISEEKMGGRSHPLFVRYKRSLLPSFPLRMAIAYLDERPEQVLVEEGHIRLKGETIPTFKGEMLIRFNRGQVGFPRYSFVDVLQGKNVPPLISNRIALVGFGFEEGRISTPLNRGMSESEYTAWVLDSILNKNVVLRPFYVVYIELLVMLLVSLLTVFILPRMGQLERLGAVIGIAALCLMSEFMLLSMIGVWVKTVYLAGCVLTIYVVMSVRHLFGSEGLSKESIEANRSLCLSLQSQGLLDLAFDQFRKLPLEGETKDLIYNLGLDYEKKRMPDKALAVYDYIYQEGPFKDLDGRMARVREADRSSTIESHDGVSGASFLEDLEGEEITHVGRYEILGTIGRGSMGLVYKALDPRINRLLAIKTIRFSDEFDEDVIQEIKERFLREAEIAGRLSHISIVTIYDLGEDRDLTYMAMEYLDGYDLEKFVTKGNLLPLRRILYVIASVADALEFAHKAHVIHRDIKPANIMLLKRGGIKVTDFGIAKAISSSRTKAGVILGTPNYMSPEQIMGQKIDLRSDIFSLGVLFFQLLTGELPFHGDNLSSLLYQITQVRHPPLNYYNPKIPRPFGQIVDKALAKDPKDRFQSAGEMSKVLRVLVLKMDLLKKKRGA
ncbi:MAG: serine/threonine-protein kinase [Pseudomonadota bacterium]